MSRSILETIGNSRTVVVRQCLAWASSALYTD
jgi:hypothetical protein